MVSIILSSVLITLGLLGSRKLAGVYVAGHSTEKSNIQFLKRRFGTASPFDTLSPLVIICFKENDISQAQGATL